MKVKSDPTSAEREARVRDRVAQGNDFSTARDSKLQILLLDKSSLTIGPNARLKIDRFVYDANRKASAIGTLITKWAFRFLSGKAVRANPGQSAITTPIATIGIRGTMVEGDEAVAIMRGELGAGSTSKIDPKTATLVVLWGPGPRSSEKRGEVDITAANRTITVSNPGQAACVPGPGVEPIGPFTLSERGYRAFDSALRTVPTSVAQSQQSDSTKSGQGMPVKSGNGLGLAGRLGLGLASVGGPIVAISISDNNSSNRPVRL